jgi:hypothetical protein
MHRRQVRDFFLSADGQSENADEETLKKFAMAE